MKAGYLVKESKHHVAVCARATRPFARPLVAFCTLALVACWWRPFAHRTFANPEKVSRHIDAGSARISLPLAANRIHLRAGNRRR
jgi:hypothetical protein